MKKLIRLVAACAVCLGISYGIGARHARATENAAKKLHGFCRCGCDFQPDCNTAADCGGAACAAAPSCC